MLKVEPLSMEWFNTSALRLQAATGVSRGAASEADLMELVRQGLTENYRRWINRPRNFAGKSWAISLPRSMAPARFVLSMRFSRRSAPQEPEDRMRLRLHGRPHVVSWRRPLGAPSATRQARLCAAATVPRRTSGVAWQGVRGGPGEFGVTARQRGGRGRPEFCGSPGYGRITRISRAMSGASLQLMEAN